MESRDAEMIQVRLTSNALFADWVYFSRRLLLAVDKPVIPARILTRLFMMW